MCLSPMGEGSNPPGSRKFQISALKQLLLDFQVSAVRFRVDPPLEIPWFVIFEYPLQKHLTLCFTTRLLDCASNGMFDDIQIKKNIYLINRYSTLLQYELNLNFPHCPFYWLQFN